jgi:hypothetical protein
VTSVLRIVTVLTDKVVERPTWMTLTRYCSRENSVELILKLKENFRNTTKTNATTQSSAISSSPGYMSRSIVWLNSLLQKRQVEANLVVNKLRMTVKVILLVIPNQ